MAKILGSKGRRPQKLPKKDTYIFFHKIFKSLHYHEIHSGYQNHYQKQDLSWFLIKLFISFDTDQNPVFDTFGIKVNYLQYPEVPYVPMFFNFSVSNCSSTFRRETWAQLLLQVFFFWFFKKGIFIGYFDLFFDREEQSRKNFLHYKPCPLTI